MRSVRVGASSPRLVGVMAVAVLASIDEQVSTLEAACPDEKVVDPSRYGCDLCKLNNYKIEDSLPRY